jgi:hypothetical protein
VRQDECFTLRQSTVEDVGQFRESGSREDQAMGDTAKQIAVIG